MSNESKLLAKLKEREAKLKAQIKEAQKAEGKKQTAVINEKNRALGAAILAECETAPELLESLRPILDKHTKNAKTRKLLGLPPLQKNSPANAG